MLGTTDTEVRKFFGILGNSISSIPEDHTYKYKDRVVELLFLSLYKRKLGKKMIQLII